MFSLSMFLLNWLILMVIFWNSHSEYNHTYLLEFPIIKPLSLFVFVIHMTQQV